MAPSATSPTRPRPLSKPALATALAASKFQLYTETTTSLPPPRRGLPPASSTIASTANLPISGGISTSSSNTPAIRTLAWSPTGSLIATADARVARVWNPERPGVRYSTELKVGGKGGSIAGTERVAWNPVKEAELASVGADGVVRFWDVRAKGACVGEVKVGGEGFSLAWRPSGEELVVGRKDDTLIPLSRTTLTALSPHRQPVQTNQISFTHSGAELLLTTGDSTVKILDYPSMAPLHTLTAHTSSCYTVLPSPTGRYLAIGGSDALITLWDTSSWTCRHSFAEPQGPIRSLSFTWDGCYVSGGSDEGGGGIGVYHVESGELVWTVPTQGVAAPCVGWHPARYWVAWGGEGGLRVLGAGGGVL